MKKHLIIFVMTIVIIGKASAQLTLDHTFPGLIGTSYQQIDEPIGLYYSSNYFNSNTIYLYNSNYSLYKTILIDLPSDYILSYASSLGRHIINTDDKVEFFIYATSTDNYPYSYWSKIINEDGVVIQDLGYGSWMSLWAVYKVGTQLRINIAKQENQSNQTTDVYICNGNYNAVTSHEDGTNTMRPYPNPTTTLINLPYSIDKGTVSTIYIYNINGQLVDSYNIGGDFKMITIDVNNYAKGIYVYEYNGISNKFVVQ